MKSSNANRRGPSIAADGAEMFGSNPPGAAPSQPPTPSTAASVHPSALACAEDRQHDYSLRPRSLAEFVGRKRIRKVLAMAIEAAHRRGEPRTMIDLRTASRSPAPAARHRRAAPAIALAHEVPELRLAIIEGLFQACRLIAYLTVVFNVTDHY